MPTWKIAAFFFFSVSAVFSQMSIAPKSTLQKHFEWGEFDSLLLKTPEILADSANLSPAETARLWLYLGVSYFVGGDSLRAQDCVTAAREKDSAMVLDAEYLNEPTIAFMRRAQERWAQSRSQGSPPSLSQMEKLEGSADSAAAPRVDSPSRASGAAQSPMDTAVASPPDISGKGSLQDKAPGAALPGKRKNRRALYYSLSGSMAIAGVVFAGLALMEKSTNDGIFEKLTRAGRIGDTEGHKKYSSDLEDSNIKLLTYTGVAIAAGAGTLTFAVLPYFKKGSGKVSTQTGAQMRVAF